jgi:hypothetical protein
VIRHGTRKVDVQHGLERPRVERGVLRWRIRRWEHDDISAFVSWLSASHRTGYPPSFLRPAVCRCRDVPRKGAKIGTLVMSCWKGGDLRTLSDCRNWSKPAAATPTHRIQRQLAVNELNKALRSEILPLCCPVCMIPNVDVLVVLGATLSNHFLVVVVSVPRHSMGERMRRREIATTTRNFPASQLPSFGTSQLNS